MRTRFLLLGLAFAGASLFAQQTPAPSKTAALTSVIQSNATPAAGCPVDFAASVAARSAGLRAIQNTQADTSGIRLDLSLHLTPQPLDKRTIVGADILVHGYSGKPHTVPVNISPTDDRTQTFQLNAHPLRTSVQVDRMLFVNWAEITELRFTDGTTWRPSANAECHATPSGLQLLTADAR